ncbi:MAG: sensor histidine kinase, partial [Proteobacteria bacterium]|nr:sensor histidine kinase [Pseudomonadota bacterium]
MMQSLSFKLPVALVVLFSLIGITMVVLTRYSGDRYYQEVTQRLNAPVAMYVTGEAPLIRNGTVNTPALESLAHKAMIVNPSVEVYLLDTKGRVLAHGLGSEAKVSSGVALEPIRLFLQETSELPMHGDDPRRPEKQKIFAAAEVVSDGVL